MSLALQAAVERGRRGAAEEVVVAFVRESSRAPPPGADLLALVRFETASSLPLPADSEGGGGQQRARKKGKKKRREAEEGLGVWDAARLFVLRAVLDRLRALAAASASDDDEPSRAASLVRVLLAALPRAEAWEVFRRHRALSLLAKAPPPPADGAGLARASDGVERAGETAHAALAADAASLALLGAGADEVGGLYAAPFARACRATLAAYADEPAAATTRVGRLVDDFCQRAAAAAAAVLPPAAAARAVGRVAPVAAGAEDDNDADGAARVREAVLRAVSARAAAAFDGPGSDRPLDGGLERMAGLAAWALGGGAPYAAAALVRETRGALVARLGSRLPLTGRPASLLAEVLRARDEARRWYRMAPPGGGPEEVAAEFRELFDLLDAAAHAAAEHAAEHAARTARGTVLLSLGATRPPWARKRTVPFDVCGASPELHAWRLHVAGFAHDCGAREALPASAAARLAAQAVARTAPAVLGHYASLRPARSRAAQYRVDVVFCARMAREWSLRAEAAAELPALGAALAGRLDALAARFLSLWACATAPLADASAVAHEPWRPAPRGARPGPPPGLPPWAWGPAPAPAGGRVFDPVWECHRAGDPDEGTPAVVARVAALAGAVPDGQWRDTLRWGLSHAGSAAEAASAMAAHPGLVPNGLPALAPGDAAHAERLRAALLRGLGLVEVREPRHS